MAVEVRIRREIFPQKGEKRKLVTAMEANANPNI